ncbi:MAG TPA: hypothetical protein PK625_10640 [Spirochaetales bacterium]|nr:zf-HC2 domain-containing protein [Spirochaetia bacterium]HPE37602.1 hypothetical protein [Spirochaetales bacterium]
MCPGRDLLSAWVDGEVPSPWRESIGKHVGECARCAETVERFRSVSRALRGDEDQGALAAASERVLDRLYRTAPPARRLSVWTRRVAVPLPAAAAAAVVALALGLAVALTGARNAELRMAMKNVVQPAPAVATGLGMESILEYLSGQEAGVNITITLPAGSGTQASGEPFIIREADYQKESDQ